LIVSLHSQPFLGHMIIKSFWQSKFECFSTC